MPKSDDYSFKYRITGPGLNDERFAILKEGEPFYVGRQGNGLQLLDASISRQHFHFIFSGGKLKIVDMASTNGTYVSGKKVDQSDVSKGALIQFGVFAL